MNITSVKIRKLFDNDDKLRALVSVTLENNLVVHDIKIIKGEERTFVAMPSKKDKLGNFHDIVHPISAEARAEFESAVLTYYFDELEKMKSALDNQ